MKGSNNIIIGQGSYEEAFRVSLQIPEFSEPYTVQNYQQRIGNKPALILIAWENYLPVGFKLGYLEPDYFYSWMGGVIPTAREKGIARMLASEQERMLREQGVDKIRFKTRNRFTGMLIFALKNDYRIIGTEPFDNEIIILLEKQL